ncbi:MAG: septum formation initiator family protein [Proteobacteria bacterium]|nr:septum formation initiator family protein [Pseudomonadota bacterium]
MMRLSLIVANSVILLGLIAAVCALMGDTRVVKAWTKLGSEVVAAKAELLGLQDREVYLRHRLGLLSHDQVDADMLGELARQKNGLYLKNEIVIPYDDADNSDNSANTGNVGANGDAGDHEQ